MLLLKGVLIHQVYLAVEVLKAGSLAKFKELVVDEAILDVVELVGAWESRLRVVSTPACPASSAPASSAWEAWEVLAWVP
jgi:hypothetical protein